MEMALGDLISVMVPGALLLWLIRGVAELRTTMATVAQKQTSLDDSVKGLRDTKHQHANRIQELTNRVALIEFQLKGIDSKP
ncbi:MAG: hypothetical protein GY879_09200 [Planctomycetes bacterium]|nr:hypothetical protein [Planctomycetota bacterium]